MDSLDLDVANRERMRLRLFQFSLHDQASNWLERLPAGSISIWEYLTTRFLSQFFPSRTIDQSAGGKLHDRNTEESWALLEDLALYDNESWNDPRDFAKLVKAISLLQDVSSTSDHRLIKLKNQVQRLMEAHLAHKQPIQVNKINSSCEICSGPHDTRYCMDFPIALEQNRNPSSPKRVHFVNSIIILNKEDEAKESTKSSATEYKDHEMTVESKEEFEENTMKKRKITRNIFDVFPHYEGIRVSRMALEKSSRLMGRKAHLLEDKQILSVGVFDEIFSTWMAFGGNTCDLGSFGEETDKTTDLHQNLMKNDAYNRGDGVATIKQHRRDLSSDGVEDLTTASGHNKLKLDLEDLT
ncbi:MAK10-like protein, partial [Tanacetum coccineum]